MTAYCWIVALDLSCPIFHLTGEEQVTSEPVADGERRISRTYALCGLSVARHSVIVLTDGTRAVDCLPDLRSTRLRRVHAEAFRSAVCPLPGRGAGRGLTVTLRRSRVGLTSTGQRNCPGAARTARGVANHLKWR